MMEDTSTNLKPIITVLLPNETLRKFLNDYKWHFVGCTVVAFSLYILRRRFFASPEYKNPLQIKGKTVIVTGSLHQLNQIG
jgi:hypothetical protein